MVRRAKEFETSVNGIGGLPVESFIPVPGLRPPIYGPDRQLRFDSRTNQPINGNLEEKLPDIKEAITREPTGGQPDYRWFQRLAAEVRQHKKSAIVYAALGGLTILSAVGAGYEFGIKQGEDIRDFYSRMQRIKRKF